MSRTPTLTRRAPPIYGQISDSIRAQIESGELLPGDRLPPIRELSRDYDCNYHARALAGGGLDAVREVEPVRFVIRESCGASRLDARALTALVERLQSRG